MNIKKCDLCKKEINEKDRCVSVVFVHSWKEFCEKCGLPVLKFLKRNKFLEKNIIKNS